MAVTSIWRVKGWLGKVVVYVENPDKTTNPAYYEKEDLSEKECQGLDDVIAYAVSSSKTQQTVQEEEIVERFVSGVNCHQATARMAPLPTMGINPLPPAKQPRRLPTGSVWNWHSGYGVTGIKWWLPPIWTKRIICITILC